MTGRGFPGFLTPEDIGLPPLADEETFRQHLELTLRDIQSQVRATLTKAQQSVEFIEGIQSDDIIIERDPVTGKSRWSLANVQREEEGTDGGLGVPVSLVTHRSTIGGTPTLNGRTDWTRTSAEIVAGTMPAGLGEDDLANCLVTLPASGMYIDGANEKFKAAYWDVEYDEYGRVASNSDLFVIDMHTGDTC